MWAVVLILIGMAVLVCMAYFYRDGLKAYFKKNKKKLAAAGTGLAIISAGSGALLFTEDDNGDGVLPFIPEGYRPNILLYITTSTGRILPATEAYLRLAIDDAQNGSVTLPAGYIDVTTDLNIGRCVVEGLGSDGYLRNGHVTQINLSNNATIQMSKGSHLRHLKVEVDVNHVEEAVNLTAGSNFWGFKGILEDICIRRYNQDITKGIGFKMYAGNNSAIALCSFNDIWIEGFEYAMWMESFEGQTGVSFINGNHFNSLFLSNNKYCLKMYEHGSGTGQGAICENSFSQISLEPTTGTDEGIIMTGYVCRNNFHSVESWDWHICTGQIINITTSDADWNYFQGYFKGTDVYITDNAQGNVFFENKDIYAKEYQMSGNLTVDLNMTANKFIGDGGNITGLHTRVWNSNDNSYEATASGLQDAFDNLNNESGWVGNPANISTSTTIKISDKCNFFGFGESTGLYLADGSDCNLIENYDQTNGNDNIQIRNMKLDGNAAGQTYAWDIHPQDQYWCIFFKYVNDSKIDNCVITDGVEGNVFWWEGDRNEISNCNSSYAGSTIPNTADNYACGFFLENWDDSSIQECLSHDNYANGITIETHYQLSYTGENFSKNWIIDDCIFYNNYAGVYNEKVKDGTISNCISYNNNNQVAYTGAGENSSGFILGLYTYNVTINNCYAHHNGDLSGDASARGWGFFLGSPDPLGGNCSVLNCRAGNNVYADYFSDMEGTKIQGCTSLNAGYYGIWFSRAVSGCTIDISDNTVIDSVDDSIRIEGVNTKDWSGCVSNNIIDGCGDYSISIGTLEHLIISNNVITESADDGIYITGGGSAPYMGNHTIDGNNIQSDSVGIYLVNTLDNIVTGNRVIADFGCTESGAITDYTILDNCNFRGCNNAHTVNAANSKVGTIIAFDGT